MRTRHRIAALSLALCLVIATAGCKPWPPSRPTEDGPPLPSTGAGAASSVATSSAEMSAPTHVATAPAPAVDPIDELKRTARAAAVKAVEAASVPDIGALSAGTPKLAKDGGGTWWASVVVMPERTDVDGATVYLRFTAHGWTVVDLGTGIDPAHDDRFPAEVGRKL